MSRSASRTAWITGTSLGGRVARTLATVASLGVAASILGGCKAPALDAYDPNVKFHAGVQQKTAVLFLEPAENGAVRGEDRPRIDEFAKDFRDRNAGPIGIAIGAAGKFDPAAAAFANNVRDSL